MAVDLLCCGIIHRCRAEMRRPQASQLVAGKRTDVPVSSQGMQWKWHLKAKCREQVPNLPLPPACGTWHRQGQAAHYPSGLPNHSRFPVSMATCPSLAFVFLPDLLPIPALAGHRYNRYRDHGQESSHRHDA